MAVSYYYLPLLLYHNNKLLSIIIYKLCQKKIENLNKMSVFACYKYYTFRSICTISTIESRIAFKSILNAIAILNNADIQ